MTINPSTFHQETMNLLNVFRRRRDNNNDNKTALVSELRRGVITPEPSSSPSTPANKSTTIIPANNSKRTNNSGGLPIIRGGASGSDDDADTVATLLFDSFATHKTISRNSSKVLSRRQLFRKSSQGYGNNNTSATSLGSSTSTLASFCNHNNNNNNPSITPAIASNSNNNHDSSTIPPPVSYLLLKHPTSEAFGYIHNMQRARSLSKATALAGRCGRPLFYVRADLAQADVHAVGRDLLSHPLIVEALENYFVPVHITVDEACCSQDDEDPSVQDNGDFSAPGSSSSDDDDECYDISGPAMAGFVDHETGENLAGPIRWSKLSPLVLVQAIIEALTKQVFKTPRYLSLLLEELQAQDGQRQAYFRVDDDGMVASTEVAFASLDGVLATCTGRCLGRGDNGNGVVRISYDAQRLSYGELARFAIQNVPAANSIRILCQTNDERMAARVEACRRDRNRSCGGGPPMAAIDMCSSDFLDTFHPSYHHKAALRRTPMRFVPATPLQLAKVNRLIHLGRFDEAMHLLSPRQGLIVMEAMRSRVDTFHDVVDFPILQSWLCFCNREDPRDNNQHPELDDDDNADDMEDDRDSAPELFHLLGTV